MLTFDAVALIICVFVCAYGKKALPLQTNHSRGDGGCFLGWFAIQLLMMMAVKRGG